jgi:hypothetical protein
MKIRLKGPRYFMAEGRTNGQREITKLIVAFRKFVNAPKMGTSGPSCSLFYTTGTVCFNVCGYRRPKLNGTWSNVKRDFKEVCHNIGEFFKTC